MSLTPANGILEDICAEIGYTATTTLVDWFGGGGVCIPIKVTEDHPIGRVIGAKPFARLVGEWGGQILDIPLDYRRERTRRNKLIGALIAKGVSTKHIARIATMTENQIKNIRTELEEANVLPMILRGDAALAAIDSVEHTIDDICSGGVEVARRDALILSLATQLKDARRRLAEIARDNLFSVPLSSQAKLFEDEA